MELQAKKVTPIELFYDLIYVYAIAKLTQLIEEPSLYSVLYGYLAVISLAVFYFAIHTNHVYYHKGIPLLKQDRIISIISMMIGFVLVMLIKNSYGFLIGALVIVVTYFFILLNKRRMKVEVI